MLEPTSRLPERSAASKVDEIVGSGLKRIAKDDVTIILPVLNEEDGVRAVIDELFEYGYRNILVVDGNSTDHTAQVARNKGAVVITQHGVGKTGAVLTAIEQVSTPYLLVMDGDFTYAAADIEKFLDHAQRYDEIVGARQPKNISRLHRLGNGVICGIFNTLFGTILTDVCSGMYLMNSKSAKRLLFNTKGFSVEVELLAQMSMQGSVTQVEINYRERIGKAKLVTWKNGFDIIKSCFNLARLYNPVFLFSVTTACAAIPGLAILFWVLVVWLDHRGLRTGWALAGTMMLLLASQAFFVGTISLLLKRSELRMERLVREEMGH
jgi:dolichol-phosphate mannosyltransferase